MQIAAPIRDSASLDVLVRTLCGQVTENLTQRHGSFRNGCIQGLRWDNQNQIALSIFGPSSVLTSILDIVCHGGPQYGIAISVLSSLCLIGRSKIFL